MFFRGVSTNKRVLIVLFVQMLMASVLLAMVFNQINNVSNAQKLINSISEKDSYVINDFTQFEKILKLSYSSNMSHFYDFVVNTVNHRYSMYSYQPVSINGGPFQKECLINHNLYQKLPIKVSKGRGFESYDFEWGKYIPAPMIVGHNLQGVYEMGKTYQIPYGGDGLFYEAVVIGVIEKGFTYPNFRDPSKADILDNSYFIPMSDTYMKVYADFPDYQMALNSTFFVTDDKEALESIVRMSTKEDLLAIEFVSTSERMKEVKDNVRMRLLNMLFIIAIILSFSLLGLHMSIQRMLDQKRRYYVVHLLCGATSFSLVLRITAEILFVICISFILATLIIKPVVQFIFVTPTVAAVILFMMIPAYQKIRSQCFLYEPRRNK